MAKLTTKQRNALPSSDFADPKNRKYPIEDASHVANAKSRLAGQKNKGKIGSKKAAADEKRIDAAAKKKGVGTK